jgi:hypothetical protein
MEKENARIERGQLYRERQNPDIAKERNLRPSQRERWRKMTLIERGDSKWDSHTQRERERRHKRRET